MLLITIGLNSYMASIWNSCNAQLSLYASSRITKATNQIWWQIKVMKRQVKMLTKIIADILVVLKLLTHTTSEINSYTTLNIIIHEQFWHLDHKFIFYKKQLRLSFSVYCHRTKAPCVYCFIYLFKPQNSCTYITSLHYNVNKHR